MPLLQPERNIDVGGTGRYYRLNTAILHVLLGFSWRVCVRHSFRLVAGLVLLVGSLPALAAEAQQYPRHYAGAAATGNGRLPAFSPEAPDWEAPYSPPARSLWWHSFTFYAACCVAVLALTFGEWRWMIARQDELRALVKERTRELEAEKAALLKAKAALVQLAAYDFLTGIFNRGAIFDLLEQEIARCQREQCSFAVVLTDLDNFKHINDTYGHLVGDEVLREFARRITRNLRPYDNAGRFGGEELLVLLPGMKDNVGDRIRELHKQVTQQPFVLSGLVLQVTCSFGVAYFSDQMNSVELLLSFADRALYAAKANGRNRVEVAEVLSISAAEKIGG